MLPNFLYIGAPRAGSTWLARNLQKHPNIWVPPCKNILYFHPRFQIYRLKALKNFWREALFSKDHETKEWYARFFGNVFVNDHWYASLFPNQGIRGEIAEAYCSLREKHVEKIHKLIPDLKIIFILRNPVERSISHAKLSIKRKKITSQKIIERELLRHINHPSSENRTNYTRALDLWLEFFPRDQFLIGFYEDLSADPASFMKSICDFLKVECAPEFFINLEKNPVNISGEYDVPEKIKIHTAQKYAAETEALAERFGGHALKWQQDLEKILKI